MTPLILVVQVLVALVILNVWLLRAGRATDYRGGDAKTMLEEFAVYGLPGWFMYLVGALKISFAICLLAGVWVPTLTLIGSVGLGALMLGAVMMHVKVRDTLKKTYPSLTLFLLCVLVAVPLG